MKATAVGIFVLLVLTCTFPFQALSQSEERFGPWLYYAPYYFPPDGRCLGHCLSADDFRPTYESPNPPQPRNDAPPPCAAPPGPPNPGRHGKLASQATRQMPPMNPALGDQPGSPSKRPFPASAAKPQALTTPPGRPPVAPSPRQSSQPPR
jgi:hypothetical protein